MEKLTALPDTATPAWNITYPYLGDRVDIYKDKNNQDKFYLAYIDISENYYNDSYFILTASEYALFDTVEFDPSHDALFAQELLNIFYNLANDISE